MTNRWEISEGVGEYPAAVKSLLMEPSEFLRQVDPVQAVGRAAVFALISFVIAGAAQVIWSLVLGGLQIGLAGMAEENGAMAGPLIQMLTNVGSGVAYPVFGFIGIFIGAGIAHFFLMLLGGANQGYMTSVKAYMYATAPYVLNVVPICGPIVGGIWSMVISIVALAELHRTSTGKAVGAVLLPMLLCCVCLLIVIVVAVFAGGLSLAALISEMQKMG